MNGQTLDIKFNGKFYGKHILIKTDEKWEWLTRKTKKKKKQKLKNNIKETRSNVNSDSVNNHFSRDRECSTDAIPISLNPNYSLILFN